jgi:hypothetical protein
MSGEMVRGRSRAALGVAAGPSRPAMRGNLKVVVVLAILVTLYLLTGTP